MQKAVIYARYSSDNQRDESIDAQVRACRAYAKQHDFDIVHVYADKALSGVVAKPQHAQLKEHKGAEQSRGDILF